MYYLFKTLLSDSFGCVNSWFELLLAHAEWWFGIILLKYCHSISGFLEWIIKGTEGHTTLAVHFWFHFADAMSHRLWVISCCELYIRATTVKSGIITKKLMNENSQKLISLSVGSFFILQYWKLNYCKKEILKTFHSHAASYRGKSAWPRKSNHMSFHKNIVYMARLTHLALWQSSYGFYDVLEVFYHSA